MPEFNPFSTFHICDLKKYDGKNVSFEKLMFTDYPYIRFIYEKLERYRYIYIVRSLVNIGEEPLVSGICRNCHKNLSAVICFYREPHTTSCGRTTNVDFQARCEDCEKEYLGRGYKHHSIPVKFSSIMSYDTVHDRKIFINELKYATGAPKKLSNESAARFFFDIYQKIN